MALCPKCRSIPFRKIIEGDNSLPTAPARDSLAQSYHHRFYDSIPHLVASSTSCKLCSAIKMALESSFWYENMMKPEDNDRPIWLCLPVGWPSPAIWIYLGKDGPEIKVFGKDLGIYTVADDPLAVAFSFRYVHESPTHHNSLKQVDKWLNACLENHGEGCRVAKQASKLPRRLVDLHAMPGREAMLANTSWPGLFHNTKCMLVENQTEEYGYYTALSYCWGTTLAYKTTKDNIHQHTQGIEFKRLPQSLQDGILITRCVGLRYIWIDCLCIVQDDKADWQREAASMGDIYSNSYLTIAGTRASDSGEGFLGPRKTKPMELITFEDKKGSFQLAFHAWDVSPMPGANESASLEPLRNEPLSQRVWSLQERLLSPRTLHFATDQMYWECAQDSKGEDGESFGAGDEDFRLHDIIEGLQSSSRFNSPRWRWFQLVRAYTSRNMTYQSDKLPALSGVIAAIQRQTNDEYYAGIWKQHFLEGLLWRLEQPESDLYALQQKHPRKVDAWRAPSWSFAAVEGVIRYEDCTSFGTSYCATLEQCSITMSGENPFGELKAGFTTIRGPLTTIEQVGHQRTFSGYECFVRLREQKLVKASVCFDFVTHRSCAVLMITPYNGLAITEVDEARNSYVRVGIIQVGRGNYDDPLLDVTQYADTREVLLL